MPERKISIGEMDSLFGSPKQKKKPPLSRSRDISVAEMDDLFGGDAPATAPPPAQETLVNPESLQGRGIGQSPIDQGIASVVGEGAVNIFAQAETGIFEGLAEILGFPIDMTTLLIRKFGEKTGINIMAQEGDPFGGSEHLKDFFRFLGVPEHEAVTATDHLVRNFGTALGSTVPFVGALGKAAQIAQKGFAIKTLPLGSQQVIRDSVASKLRGFVAELPQVPGALKGVGREMVQAARLNPVATAAAELVSGGFSGVGREAAGQLSEEFNLEQGGLPDQLVRTAGEFVGGFTPAVTTGVLSRVGSRITTMKGAKKSLAKATEQTAGRILREAIPGGQLGDTPAAELQLTLAAAYQHPVLVGIEKQLSSKGLIGRDMAERMGQMRSHNDQVIRDGLNAAAPADLSAESGIKLVRNRLEKLDTALDNRIESVLTAVDSLVSKAGNPARHSEASREALNAAAEEFRVNAGRFYDRVRNISNEDKVFFAMNKINAKVDDVRRGITRSTLGDEIPSEILDKIDLINKVDSILIPKNRIDYTELRQLRSSIGRLIREQEALSVPNKPLIRRLNILQDGVESTLNDVGAGNPRLKIAQDYANSYFANNVDKFRSGEVARQLSKGRSAPPASATLDYFITTGKSGTGGGAKEKALQFIDAVGSRPAAIQEVEDFIVGKLYNAAGRNGQVKFKTFQKELRKYDEVLSQFPEARKRVSKIGDMLRRAEELGLRKTRAQSAVDYGAAQAYIGGDARQAVREIIRSNDPMATALRLRKLYRNAPDAEKGVKRAWWDVFSEKFNSPEVDRFDNPFLAPESMDAFINTNEPAMRASGFKADEMDRIRRMVDLAKIAKRIKQNDSVAFDIHEGRGPITRLKTILPFTMVASRLYAIERGIVGTRFVATEVTGRIIRGFVEFLNKEQLERLLMEALTDPSFAKQLMMDVPLSQQGKFVTNIRAQLALRGIFAERAGGTLRENRQEQEQIGL